MKSVELRYSKSKIDKAGELLKSGADASNEMIQALDVLSNWRAKGCFRYH